MGILSRFENKMEDGIEGAAGMVGRSSISPVQITKKAEKLMRREKVVGAGKQYAPTLYTVLISSQDDSKLFKYYPTLAGETETYLKARARELGYVMDGQPLVRFLADPDLKRGKFEVVAELVASSIIEQLRDDEMRRYGLPTKGSAPRARAAEAQRERNLQPNLQPLPNLNRSNPSEALANAQAASINGANAYKVGPGGGYQDLRREEPRPSIREERYEEAGFVPLQRASEPTVYEDEEVQEELSYEPMGMDAAEAVGAAVVGEAVGAQAVVGAQAAAQVHQAQPQAGQASAQPAQPGAQAQAQTPAASAQRSPGTDVYLYDEARDWAVELTGNPQRIGREEGNDIVIPDINASRVHAEIMRQPNGVWVITDLNSTNGLLINGRKVQSAPLRDADMISIGATTLEFQKLS